jgi:nucleoid-associated protein YgaU
LEGKLRDSAAARKQADQARMEAERRLAEGTQEMGRQGAEISLLRDAREALQAQVGRLEQQAAQSARSLQDAEESLRKTSAERDAALLELQRLGRELAAQRDRQRASEASLEERLAALAAEKRALEEGARDRDAELRRMRTALSAAESERDAHSRRLDALRALIPARDGGSLTAEAATEQARAAAVDLVEARARATADPRDHRARQSLRAAEQMLHRRQFYLARTTGARSVYRVRAHDSLASIARRFHGDSSRWQVVYEANRHVVDDPDHLDDGVTLVIP